MKYKVGDVVKVRSDLSTKGMNVTNRMLNFRGKIVRIEKVFKNGCYRIEGDYEEWNWTDEMLEPLTEEDIKGYLEKYTKDFKNYNIKFEIKKKESILNEKEKQYLSAVIRPFRDRVMHITKYYEKGYQYISINVIPIGKFYNDLIELPRFKVNTMYKGMIPHKEYTLEELGI